MKSITILPEDYLYCKVSIRRSSSTAKDFPAKMWFNGNNSSDHGCGNYSWSRIHKVTQGGSTQNYYYFKWGTDDYLPLETTPGNDNTYIQVNNTSAFTEFGT